MGTDERSWALNFFVDNHEEIKEGTRCMAREMLECMVESDYQRMAGLLDSSKALRYSIQGYEEDVDVLVEVKEKLTSAGYASALMDVMQMYIERVGAQSEILKVSTKYRDKVLRILAKHGTLLHGDLASFLEVSPSGLNAIIKKMNETSVKLVNVEEVSKFKLYSITPVAYKYIMTQYRKVETDYEINLRRRLYAYATSLKYSKCKLEQDWYVDYIDRAESENTEKVEFKLIKNEKYSGKEKQGAQILPYRNWSERISI